MSQESCRCEGRISSVLRGQEPIIAAVHVSVAATIRELARCVVIVPTTAVPDPYGNEPRARAIGWYRGASKLRKSLGYLGAPVSSVKQYQVLMCFDWAHDNVTCMFENAALVEVAVAPSVEEFAERYVRCERPVIVRGGVKDWPPSYKWTLEYLKAMCGTRRIRIGVSASGDYVDYAERLKIGVEPEVAFAKAIDDIFAPGNAEQKSRVHQQSLEAFGALDEESPPIPYVLGKVIAKNIWMGSTGNLTKTHYDMQDNINVQLRGRKEIILYPSTQLDELYPRSAWDYMSNFSRVEIAKPDLSRYPRFSRATPLRAILEPGDFIYIPIYWWHQFYTLETSLNVNFWWQCSVGQAMRRHGLHYWPRMAKDRYLHSYVIRTILPNSGERLVGGLHKTLRFLSGRRSPR